MLKIKDTITGKPNLKIICYNINIENISGAVIGASAHPRTEHGR